jgi:1,4-dihydroxy-2-naphthoate octaprenyltransferase
MLSFGVLMTLGSYLVQAWQHSSFESELSVLLLSLPQSLLIAAILHANNHRDRRGDQSAGALTLSLAVGSARRSLALGKGFIWGAFILHGFIVLATAGERYAISAWSLVAWGSFPWAQRALALLDGSDDPTSEQFLRVVPMHAQLQAIYGGLMVVGVLVGALLAA